MFVEASIRNDCPLSLLSLGTLYLPHKEITYDLKFCLILLPLVLILVK